VVTGITMSFQFGTNWPGYMQKVGNVAGPLLAYEVLTAFFLEATFLGIMLFGRSRVSNRVHTLATFLVAFGTTVSAFWIIALNSWMQTPTGHQIVDGVYHVKSWVDVIFNPSFPYRLAHMLLASGLTAAFLVAGVSAYRWLRGDREQAVLAALRTGVAAAALLIPVQILAGDLHGINTLQHQPQKVAAMEGNWQTGPGRPLLLFAWPDEAARANQLEIGIPAGASLILTHRADGVVPGLDDFRGEHPPVRTGVLRLPRHGGHGGADDPDGLHQRCPVVAARDAAAMVAAVAHLHVLRRLGGDAGRLVCHRDRRQPWLVYGLLRTHEAAAAIPAPTVALTLAVYLSVYALLLVAYVATIFLLARKGARPRAIDTGPAPHPTAFAPAE
jgi:cytochrome d ubiquinol oxidase subunit I